MLQKELTLIKQVHQKNVCFAIIVTLRIFGFKFESHVRNKCHDVLMTAYELKNIATLKVKTVDFRCILWGVNRDEAVNRLNNSVLEDKGVLQMDFGANKTPVEVIREGAFGGTYFRDIYCSVNKVVQKVIEEI